MNNILFCLILISNFAWAAPAVPLSPAELSNACALLLSAKKLDNPKFSVGSVVRAGKRIFIVIKQGKEGEGYGHGPGDYYPPTPFVDALFLNKSGYLDRKATHIKTHVSLGVPKLTLSDLSVIGRAELVHSVRGLTILTSPIVTSKPKVGDVIAKKNNRYLIIETYMGKGGHGHGIHDYYADTLVVNALKLRDDGSLAQKTLEFYLNSESIGGGENTFQVVGRAEHFWSVTSINIAPH